MKWWLFSLIFTLVVLQFLQISKVEGAKKRGQTRTNQQFVDVTKLASLKQGTELLLIENAFHHHRQPKSYRLEDFFWTGSGDGIPFDEEDEGEREGKWHPSTTIYRTKTVLSTVYVDSSPTIKSNNTISNNNQTTEFPPKCVINCDGIIHTKTSSEINPTPTSKSNPIDSNSTMKNELEDADHQFWLLTVLKSDGKDPALLDLKNSLAKLYKTAFKRQQERHLGINFQSLRKRQKRQDSTDLPKEEKPVNVYIHKIEKGEEKLQVLYHVSVNGKPVDATTAAADMRLVSDEEVMEELGYPFLVKAEPYVKPSEPQSLASPHNTWLFIGSSLTILFVLLLAVAFLSLCINKRKKNFVLKQRNKKELIKGGNDNFGYEEENEASTKINKSKKNNKNKNKLSPTYIHFNKPGETLDNKDKRRPQSSLSITSSNSSTSSSANSTLSSVDISPLMGVHNKNNFYKQIRPKAAVTGNKTAPLLLLQQQEKQQKHKEKQVYKRKDSDSSTCSSIFSSSKKDKEIIVDQGLVQSPKSYLSMPSVKSFPRGNIPEPLNKVLEPVSVLHLDLPEEPSSNTNFLIRHGSVGTEADPGVIGPVVWNLHRQRLLSQELEQEHEEEEEDGRRGRRRGSGGGGGKGENVGEGQGRGNVARMRKRFHDLLDDTFSLFGSRRDLTTSSPTLNPLSHAPEMKSHSAFNNRESDDMVVDVNLKSRPKTSGPRRVPQPPSSSSPPKGAWTSKAPSPLIRPLSADPPLSTSSAILKKQEQSGVLVTPRVDVDQILSEGRFHRTNDPAVPLIAAIKSEIQKCAALPGSTTNLAE